MLVCEGIFCSLSSYDKHIEDNHPTLHCKFCEKITRSIPDQICTCISTDIIHHIISVLIGLMITRSMVQKPKYQALLPVRIGRLTIIVLMIVSRLMFTWQNLTRPIPLLKRCLQNLLQTLMTSMLTMKYVILKITFLMSWKWHSESSWNNDSNQW